ncbi:MAG: hypothetical protein ACYC5O_14745 [Anaerolineae bacterium]
MARQVRDELASVIDQIAGAKLRIREIERERRELAEHVDVMQARALMQVAIARDENGKPLYPNEQTRDAAHTLALEDDPGYVQARQSLWRLEDDERCATIELERLGDMRLLLLAEMGIASMAPAMAGSSVSS